MHLDSTSLGVHLDSTLRKSCGPLGGHEQGGTGTAAVDWVWEPPLEAVEKLRPVLERCCPGGGRSMNE